MFKLIEGPRSCPTKGFCSAARITTPSFTQPQDLELKQTPQTKFLVDFTTLRCSEAELVGMSRQSKKGITERNYGV